jgi:DHA2 family multidrug resistance protein
MMPLVGKLSQKVDLRILLAMGVVGVMASLWMNTHLTGQESFSDLVWPYFVRSATLGLVFIPVGIVALSDLPPEQRGNATGVFNLTRELGGSIGTATMGLILDRTSKLAQVALRSHVTTENPVTQDYAQTFQYGLGALNWTSQQLAETLIDAKIRMQALVISFNRGFGYTFVAFSVAMLLVFLLKKPAANAEVSGAH